MTGQFSSIWSAGYGTPDIWPSFDSANAQGDPSWLANTWDDWVTGIDAMLAGAGTTKLDLGLSSDSPKHVYAYKYGAGSTKVLLAAGLHGAEMVGQQAAMRWFQQFVMSTSTLAAQHRDRLSVIWIPTASPWGYRAYTGSANDPGRTNANGIDINRNFDYLWDEYVPQFPGIDEKGSAPFSEIESQMIRDLVIAENPIACVDCHNFGNTPNEVQYLAADGDSIGLAEAVDAAWTAKYGTVLDYNAAKLASKAGIPSLHNWMTARTGIPSVTVEIDSIAKQSAGGMYRHYTSRPAARLFCGFISEYFAEIARIA